MEGERSCEALAHVPSAPAVKEVLEVVVIALKVHESHVLVIVEVVQCLLPVKPLVRLPLNDLKVDDQMDVR